MNKRQPAAGYAPGDDMWETPQFKAKLDRRRKANKHAAAARKKNRK